MKYTGVYAVVLIVHILAAIFLIGPLGLAGTLAPRWVRERDVTALKSALRTCRIYSLVGIIVPVLGTGLLSIKVHGVKLWSSGDVWVIASYVLFVVAIGATFLVIAPTISKALDLLDKPSDESGAKLSTIQGKLASASGVQMTCWLVIVILMVTKPGA